MQFFSASTFRAERAWGGPNIARLDRAEVKLRWTDQPFHWHANSGQEIFAVLDGAVEMHVREPGGPEQRIELGSGDFLYLEAGLEHVAYPRGAAVILVVEEAE